MRMRPGRSWLSAFLVLSLGLARVSLAGGAGGGAPAPDRNDPEDWLQEQPGTASETWDPIEPANRGVFEFNDKVDVYALTPVARGWKAITPQAVRSAATRFFENLRFPIHLLGCLTQGRLADSAEEVGRFAVNTTVGIAGLFDPATRMGLDPHPADLGQSLGRAGLGPGPYLVVPLLGPSTARDLINIPIELLYLGFIPGITILAVVNTRAERSEDIRAARQASLDYYVFVRSAYLQQRDSLIRAPEAAAAAAP